MSFDISKVHDFNRISNLSNPYKLNKNAEKYNQNTRIFKEIWDDVHDIPNGENGQSVLLSKRKRKKEDEALAVEPVLKKMGPGEYLQYYKSALLLTQDYKNIEFKWIPREENIEADALSKRALYDIGIVTK